MLASITQVCSIQPITICLPVSHRCVQYNLLQNACQYYTDVFNTTYYNMLASITQVCSIQPITICLPVSHRCVQYNLLQYACQYHTRVFKGQNELKVICTLKSNQYYFKSVLCQICITYIKSVLLISNQYY